MVAYRQEESTRLALEMPPKEMTMTLDETFTGGLCLVGMDPESNYIVLEHTAPARDQDTWNKLMAPALAGLNCKVMQATSDEAPGLLAYVAHHLGAHHSPDLFHVQHELSKAVSAPMATKQRAAAKALAKAEETRKRVHEHRLCRKFCLGGREGAVAPGCGRIRRPGRRTVRPQCGPRLRPRPPAVFSHIPSDLVV